MFRSGPAGGRSLPLPCGVVYTLRRIASLRNFRHRFRVAFPRFVDVSRFHSGRFAVLSTETPLSQSPGDAPEVPIIPRAGEPALRPRDIEAFRALILSKLTYSVGKLPETASDFDWLTATELAVRDRIVDLWNRSDTDSRDEQARRLSVPRIPDRPAARRRPVESRPRRDGARRARRPRRRSRPLIAARARCRPRQRRPRPPRRLLHGKHGDASASRRSATASATISASSARSSRDGWQQEAAGRWLACGNPWEFERPDVVYPVRFGGSVERVGGDGEPIAATWHPAETVLAVAYDMPVVGWRGRHVNTLRLWSARAVDPLALDAFNAGDHVGAQAAQARRRGDLAGALSRATPRRRARSCACGRNTSSPPPRCRTSCAGTCRSTATLATLPDHAAIQLNDTHPAIAVAELMRLLVDVHGIGWDAAWDITARRPSTTPTTRCCRRRSRPGRSS